MAAAGEPHLDNPVLGHIHQLHIAAVALDSSGAIVGQARKNVTLRVCPIDVPALKRLSGWKVTASDNVLSVVKEVEVRPVPPAGMRLRIVGLVVAASSLVLVSFLVPLALRGVRCKPQDAASLLRRNLLIYGLGGLVAPFPGIWLIDRLLGLLHLA